MKRFIILTGIVLLMTGCGMQHGAPVTPAPRVPDLIQRGWDAYVNGNYQSSSAIFDSVITLDAANFWGYLGEGWSNIQTDEFAEAKRMLSIGLGLTGNSPTIEKNDVPIQGNNTYTIPIPNLAGILTDEVVAVVHDTLVYDSTGHNITQFRNMPGTEVYYKVVHFTDSTITVEWNSDKNPSVLIFPDNALSNDYDTLPDTFYVQPLPPESTDDLTFSYVEYRGSNASTDTLTLQADVYAARAGMYSANRDYYRAIVSARTALSLVPNYKFVYDSLYINGANLHKTIAFSCYKLKYYNNAAEEIHTYLDTGWVWDTTKATALYDLEAEIEKLLNE